ncbi:MAG: PBP1A family penicillin-binding protein [Limnothrix sp. RL_2_0]|nr:PBP1A family penicillin-binding protein [Limnothrix sp. RL_2_0]
MQTAEAQSVETTAFEPVGPDQNGNEPSPKLTPPLNSEPPDGDNPKPQKPRRKKGRWWFWFLAGMVVGAGSSGYVVHRSWQELEALVPENVDSVLIYTRPGTMTVKAADGTVIEEVGPVSHDKVKIWEVPDVISEAFVSSEDRRFYDHFGVDTQGIARAAYVNFRAGEIVEGGSSITQQVARIVFLNQEMTAMRKMKEMRLATKLEEQFTKDQILESYLNLVYLGSGAYGVTDAAWVYFGKTLDDLTLPEAAMIAGLAPAPSIYSPFVSRQKTIVRRNQVLQRMWEDGFISEPALKQAIATPLETNRQIPKRLLRRYPYFSDYIQAELDRYLTPEQLEKGGVVVETTINPQWQEWAEATLAEGIEKYGRYQGFKQAAIVSIDPRNGQIKTMVGGLDFENNQYNRVTQAQRQPGSTFKTFVYTAAIASGMSPSDTYVDSEFVIGDYKPKNYSGTFSNQPLSLTKALTQSVNTVALRVMLDVGWDPVINLAQQMGIRSEMQPTYSLALGSWEVNLLEITSAYGTLANKGVHQPNYGISRIIDRDGNIIYQAEAKPRQAVDANSAAIMTSMLTDVVSSGTGSNANIGRPVAGKTGTSDKARDLWFIGYIPQMVTGVWLGNDDNRPTWGASSTAARLWGNLMGQITDSLAVENFPAMPNLSNRVGSIEAQPVKNAPKKVTGNKKKKTNSGNSNNSETNTTDSGGNQSSPTPTDRDNATRTAPPRRSPEPTYDYTKKSDTVPPFIPAETRTPAASPAPSTAPTPAAPAPTPSTAAPAPASAPPANPAPPKAVQPAPAPARAPAPAPPANVDIPAPPAAQKREPSE